MMKSDKIWIELEEDSSFTSGLLYKRFSAEVKPDVFIALKAPENFRCLAIKLNKFNEFECKDWDTLKDIKIEKVDNEKERKEYFLLVVLINRDHAEIFSTLCEDLIYAVTSIKEEKLLTEKLLDRFAKWQALFEKIGRKGLSNEKQRGLFGELYFLKNFLTHSADNMYCLNSWKGPEMAIQDFQYSDWAVEVKTTHGNNHQKIQISSERQLDDNIIPNIFLYHLSLDVREKHGISLNDMVDELLEFFKSKIIAANLLKMKLMEYGYFNVHRYIYANIGYTIRQENIYSVENGFPRITENQVQQGVGDVRYSIVLSESEPWRIDFTSTIKKITNDTSH